MSASTINHVSVMREVLAQLGFEGVNDVRAADGHTPLSIALKLINGTISVTGVASSTAFGQIALTSLLANHADVNQKIPAYKGVNAVGLAAAFALKEPFQKILASGAEINSSPTDDVNHLPFVLAISNFHHHPDQSRAFLEHFIANKTFKINNNFIGPEKLTMLAYAALNNHTAAVEFLCGYHNVSYDVENSNVALISAMNGRVGPLNAILTAKPGMLNSMTKDTGYHALTLAAINAKDDLTCADIMRYLVQTKGFPIDTLNHVGDNALQIAAYNNSLKGVQTLITLGADVNIPFTPQNGGNIFNTGRTSLMLACNQHKIIGAESFVPVARAIAAHKALNIDHKSADGNTYLHYAAMVNDETLMRSIDQSYKAAHPGESLVDVHNSASARNVDFGTLCSNATPLNAAASESVYSLNSVKVLVAMGSNVNSTFTKYLNAQQGSESTNFTAACQGAYYTASAPIKAQFVEKAEYFLRLDTFTNYDFTDADGFNSIHWTLSLASAKLLHVLLEKMKVICGEDRCKILLNAEDNTAKSPMDWAIEAWKVATDAKKECADIITELKFHGSKIKQIHKSNDLSAIIKDAIHHHDHDLLPAYQLGGMTIDPDADLYD